MWKLSFKPTAFNALAANVPKNDLPRVVRGIDTLCQDPKPDGRFRRKLKNHDGLFRCKVHGFRVLYVFDDTHVSVLDVRPREDDHATYGKLPAPEHLGEGLDADLPEEEETSPPQPVDFLQVPPPSGRPLPEPVTEALLRALRIPKEHHAALTACTTEDELQDCPIPEQHLMAVIDGLLGRPVDQLLGQPQLEVQQADDLIEYAQGELLAFLLRLTAEQKKFVGWAMSAKGPTLLKGGPGSGKSTVAIYRVREFVEALRKAGVETPRILFTTYTRALTAVSEQLLRQLLGEEVARRVEVSTADSVAVGLFRQAHGQPKIASPQDRRRLLEEAASQATFEGNSLQQAAQRKTLEKMGTAYLLEEVVGVIEARGLASLDAYLAAPRPGRGMPLHTTQRAAVWAVREAYLAALQREGLVTWEQVRAEAARLAADAPKYDAVLIDETQDLQPNAIRMLVGLAASPGRLFLTADANQSIYGAGFRWKDVHEDLRFVGRTGVLRANHRSTREVGEAAERYLSHGGALDCEERERTYVHRGPLPVVRQVADGEELPLVVRFLRGATRALRLGTGSVAVLCPTRKQVQRVVEGLDAAKVPAMAADASNLDLGGPGVKVLTLKSAKGLEFPVVILAGLHDPSFPALWTLKTDEQKAELMDRERRTLFVAMTRAMRALLVCAPKGREMPLFEGFETSLWNTGA
jgi:superfamily I DNA/RNA helicase/mRNA-degrading endonuclease RelE of RelBE toxin-antitoxin system